MRKRIFVYAYLNNNLGDDLFIRTVCERYKNVLFYMYAGNPNYQQVFRNIQNVRLYTKYSWQIKLIKRILRKIKNRNKDRDYVRYILSHFCNACAVIGGSLFIQPSELWKKHCDSSELRIIKNKPIFIMGSNFGPFDDMDFVVEYKRIFGKYTDICFRDQYSYQLFRDLEHVRVAPDVLFNMKYEYTEANRKQVAISVISLDNREALKIYAGSYRSKICDIIRYYISRGNTIKLFSFCKPEGDEEEIYRILQNFDDNELKSISTSFYTDNMEQTISELQESDFIIATRFHSMILGWVLQIPVFPISYSDKMKNVIVDVEFQGNYADIKRIEDLSMESINYNYLNKVKLDITELQSKAELQFMGIDQLCSKRK